MFAAGLCESWTKDSGQAENSDDPSNGGGPRDTVFADSRSHEKTGKEEAGC